MFCKLFDYIAVLLRPMRVIPIIDVVNRGIFKDRRNRGRQRRKARAELFLFGSVYIYAYRERFPMDVSEAHHQFPHLPPPVLFS